tara:strand:- start:670 stop:1038 length:369 start_codon:yes stop_codon:yes gene_type:complete
MKHLEVIHRLLDDTYNTKSKSGAFSLRHSMHGSRLVLTYGTIVHFASERSLTPQVESARDQARQHIKDKVDQLKKDFKEATETTLKFKDAGEQDNIEMMQSTSNSPRKIAHYRYSQTLDFNV